MRLTWHLGPGILVDLDGVQATLFWGVGPERKQGKLALDPRLAWTLHQAEVKPIAGWYSPRFGTRVEATSPGRDWEWSRPLPLSPPNWNCHE